MSAIVAPIVSLIGGTMIMMRRWAPSAGGQAVGGMPAIPEARPQRIPTLKMPTGTVNLTPVDQGRRSGERVRLDDSFPRGLSSRLARTASATADRPAERDIDFTGRW